VAHLDYLYTLTVADICATNPKLWNSWRGSLLRQLYQQTRRALRRGLDNPIDYNELIAETRITALEELLPNAALANKKSTVFGQILVMITFCAKVPKILFGIARKF
jgi:UTP:GlnB (protein PII) uridylyltransferase